MWGAEVWSDAPAAALVTARVLPVTLIVPLFGGHLAPVVVRLGLGLVLALVLTPTAVAGALGLSELGAAALAMLAAKELLIGLTLAFAVSLLFYAVEMGASVIDTARGQLQPLGVGGWSGRPSSQSGALLVPLTVVLFLALDGHHLAIGALAQSYAWAPLVAAWPGADVGPLGWSIIAAMSQLFAVALVIGLPVLVVNLLAELTLGVLGRAAPRLHAYFLGLPIRSLLGLLVLLAMLALLAEALWGQWLDDFGRARDWIEGGSS